MGYEEEKLKFVSNLNGTQLGDLSMFLTTIPVINCLSFITKMFIIFMIHKDFNEFKKKFTNIQWFIFDFLYHVVPVLLILTVFSNWITYIQIIYTLVIFIVYKFVFLKRMKENESESESTASDEDMNKIEKIRTTIVSFTFSSFRSMVYLVTSISILAVDFKIFPREFAKTETYGISIMDIGVGAFVIAHSLKSVQKATRSDMSKTVTQTSTLVFLGILRLLSVKSTGYVEHISEYGVHWNFFFTLAIVKIFSCPFQLYVRQSALRAFMLAFIFSTLYQFFLTKKNFSSYLLHDYDKNAIKKLNFVDANKEGIFSCLGYFALYFAGQSISIYITSKIKENTTSIYQPLLRCVGYLLFLTNLFYTFLQLSKHYIENVSRRLCNISYVCLVLMCTCLFLTLSISIVLVIFRTCSKLSNKRNSDKNTSLKEAYEYIFSFIIFIDSKYIGLYIFIISNLLTGFVNLTMQTIYMNTIYSFLVLFIYSAIVTSSAYGLYLYLKSNEKKD